MRYLFGLLCVCALGMMPLVGCSETAGDGGSGGEGGEGGGGGNGVACVDSVCPCTEAGIRAAIAEGGGPYTFDCVGPQTVVTKAEILIDNDVILDGEGNLTVDGDDDHRVFLVEVEDAATSGQLVVGLRGLTVTGGAAQGDTGGGIYNLQTLTLVDCTISENSAQFSGGIQNQGILTMTNSTISGNTAEIGGAIGNGGTLNIWNSTVSGNTTLSESVDYLSNAIVNYAGFDEGGILFVSASTVSGNIGGGIGTPVGAEFRNTIVNDDCFSEVTSLGYNIESEGNTCGFDQPTDMPDMSAEELKLGELAANGGPTKTHALEAGSEAIDKIPAEDCVVVECMINGEGGLDCETLSLTTDQRGFPRDSMCDVGAFEVQP